MLEHTRKYNFIRLEAYHYKIKGPEKRQNQEDTIHWFRGKINIFYCTSWLHLGDTEREFSV